MGAEAIRVGLLGYSLGTAEETALGQAQVAKDAIRAYELVYDALGAG